LLVGECFLCNRNVEKGDIAILCPFCLLHSHKSCADGAAGDATFSPAPPPVFRMPKVFRNLCHLCSVWLGTMPQIHTSSAAAASSSASSNT
jgi:hypothetical protein